MNSIERVTAFLNHQKTDRVPVYPILSGVTRNLVGASYKEWSTNSEICSAALIKAATDFDIDCIVSLIDLSVECDAWGQELIFPENEAAHPNYKNSVIKDIDEYKNIKKADYTKSERMMMHIDVCRKLVEKKGKDVPIVAFVFGPLGTLSMLRGQQDLYMDIYDDPDAVRDAVREVNETLKDYCKALAEVGVSAIMLDTLFSSGSIMSKQMWLDMEGDAVTELADSIREAGCEVMIHNCGQKIYFDAQIQTIKPIAISFLFPPDDCKDFAECKVKYGDKTGLIGCIPPPLVVTATDEEWDAACKEQIDILGKDGGYMLATGCEYPANASFDKAKRMINIAKTYGKYN